MYAKASAGGTVSGERSPFNEGAKGLRLGETGISDREWQKGRELYRFEEADA